MTIWEWLLSIGITAEICYVGVWLCGVVLCCCITHLLITRHLERKYTRLVIGRHVKMYDEPCEDKRKL